MDLRDAQGFKQAGNEPLEVIEIHRRTIRRLPACQAARSRKEQGQPPLFFGQAVRLLGGKELRADLEERQAVTQAGIAFGSLEHGCQHAVAQEAFFMRQGVGNAQVGSGRPGGVPGQAAALALRGGPAVADGFSEAQADQQVPQMFLLVELRVAELERKRIRQARFRQVVVTVHPGDLLDQVRLAGEPLADIQAVVRAGGAHGLAFYFHLEFQACQQRGDLLCRQVKTQPAFYVGRGELHLRVGGRQRISIHQAGGNLPASPGQHQFQPAPDAAFRHGRMDAAREAVGGLGGQRQGAGRPPDVDEIPGRPFEQDVGGLGADLRFKPAHHPGDR